MMLAMTSDMLGMKMCSDCGHDNKLGDKVIRVT